MTKPHRHSRSSELHGFLIPADTDLPMLFQVINHSLYAVQDIVGGYVEELTPTLRLDLWCGCPIVILANEDGVPLRLPQNMRASTLRPGPQPIVGDIFLVGSGPVGSAHDWLSLPQAFAQWEGPGAPLPQNQKQPWEG
jgi:hypothetical protein